MPAGGLPGRCAERVMAEDGLVMGMEMDSCVLLGLWMRWWWWWWWLLSELLRSVDSSTPAAADPHVIA